MMVVVGACWVALSQARGVSGSRAGVPSSHAGGVMASVTGGTVQFAYTGSVQTWTVPAGVASVQVAATGASGEGAYGGLGGYEQAVIPVSAGETLNVYVGGMGSDNVGGYNGGGGDNFSQTDPSAAGGGASDVRIGGTALSDRVIVAGGGGGEAACAGPPSLWSAGGGGGGSTGESGWEGTGGSGSNGPLPGGGGGTQTAGGGSGGALGQGGGGVWCGGDGGGGYYGGGAGKSISCAGCTSGGGGGGSSYAEPSAVDVTSLQGFSRGDGHVTISYPAATGSGAGAGATGGVTAFTYTGGAQYYTVPRGVTRLAVTAAGAEGGGGVGGGLGGLEQAVVSVVPGQTLVVTVGGAASGSTPGFNGGAGGDFVGSGGSGGGASDVRFGATLADRVVVAGGGGGSGDNSGGGGGGGLVGLAGLPWDGAPGGGGGTQTAGGAAGQGWSESGYFGYGGGGCGCLAYDGGGGGGWYGGGTGGYSGQTGGGGGSSYAISSATNVKTVPGIRTGNGFVVISTGVYGPIPASLRRGDVTAAPGVCGCKQKSGDPVDTGTGDFNHSTTDVSVATFGPPLAFTRTYDSSLAQEQTAAGTPDVLGYGWTDNWNVHLTLQTPADAVMVHQESGAEVQFVPPVDGACPAGTNGPGTTGTYCAAPYVTATLTYDSDTQTYTFVTHPYERYAFDSRGRLISESRPGGATVTVGYGTPAPGVGQCPAAAGSCDTVTAASGRKLVIASNAAGLVTSVTDPLGDRWSYGYCATPSSTCSSGDLVSVTDPLGNVTTYTYDQGNSDPALVSDLLTITKPNGQPGAVDAGAKLTNVYDSAGRVISQTDPDGNQTTFDYSDLDASTGTGDTVVTDPDGNQTEYAYTAGILTSKIAGYGTASPSAWTYAPDPSTDLDRSVTDPDHDTTTYTYDANGNVTSVTDPDGGESTYSYNSFDEQTCATEPMASSGCSSLSPPPAITPGATITPPASAPPAYVTYSAYDTAGNPVWSTAGEYEPGGGAATQSRTTYRLYSGESVTLGASSDSCAADPPASSLPCLTINPDGVVTQLAYDSGTGDLTSSSTADGNAGGELATTTYTYDADGDLTGMVAPDGNLSGANQAEYTTTRTYSKDGQLLTQTVGAGTAARETVYGYDQDGNRTSIKDPRGYTTSEVYDADDQPVLDTDPDGHQTLTCYDGDGNVSQTVPASGVAASSLTPSSCPSSYPAGYGDRLAADATTYSYDALGDETTVTSPAPAGQTGHETTINTYDAAGRLEMVESPPASNDTSAPEQLTFYTYDADGDVLSVEKHGSDATADSITSYCYDPDGDRTASVAPDGNLGGTAACAGGAPYQTTSAFQTGYAYDSLGEVVSKTTPSTSFVTDPTTSYTYDPAGELIASKDPSGITTTDTYTPLGQLQTVSYTDSTHGVAYIYDANGNRVSMSDGTGTSTYTYDQFGELMGYENGAGKHIGYSYDPDGDLTGLTYPLGTAATWASSDTIAYGYDNADELDSVSDFNGTASRIANNPDGLPTSLSLGSTGDTLTTSYDQTDSPSEIKLTNSSATLQEFAYSDTPAGMVSGETDTPSSPLSPVAYDYDPQGRVTQMTPGSGTINSYGYDASGNPTTLPTGAAGSYDAAQELTSSTLSAATTDYTYSKDGERTQEAANGATTATSSYNAAQSLTSHEDTAADMTAATYDGDGLRQSATSTPTGGSSTTENFTWNPSGSLPELLMDSKNAYIYGPSETPFEQVNLSTGTVQYLVSDALGSVRGIVDGTGVLEATTSYDAWGNPETAGGLTNHTPIGYAGYYTDPTGLTYNIARYYDPTTGQFLTIDPLADQTGQPYQYTGDDPLNDTDASGQQLSWEDLNPVHDVVALYNDTAGARHVTANFLAGTAESGAQTINFTTSLLTAGQYNPNLNVAPAYCGVGGYSEGEVTGYGLQAVSGGELLDLGAATEGGSSLLSRFLSDETGSLSLGGRYTEDQQALQELVNEATNGGRVPLSAADAKTVGDWAGETGYPGARAASGDVASPSNWGANPVPHVHLPGVGRGGHIPVEPGALSW